MSAEGNLYVEASTACLIEQDQAKARSQQEYHGEHIENARFGKGYTN